MLRLLGTTLTTVILLIMIPVLLSGCRVGNRTSTKLSGYDLVSGYYMTEPSSLSITKKIGPNGSLVTIPSNVQNIPSSLKNTMNNPMIIQITNLSTGDAVMINPVNNSLGFDIKVNTDTKTIALSIGGFATITGCRIDQTIIRNGSYNEQAGSIAGVQARGRVSLDYTTEYKWSGDDADCNPWLETAFHDCYVDDSQCTDFSSDFVHSIYDPFIQSGFMSVADIKTARLVSYTARYR